MDIEGETVPRRELKPCAICARGLWSEKLVNFDLFHFPKECEHDRDDDHNSHSEEEPDDARQPTTSFKVLRPRKISSFLSIEAYMKRWPLLPRHENFAKIVVHPKGRNKDGSPWRWILNRAAVQEGKDSLTVVACRGCATDLSGKGVFACPHML